MTSPASTPAGLLRKRPLGTSQSFTEFFSASTPVPASVTLLLSYTAPSIHLVHQLLQLLTWTSDRSVKSFLVLFAWWAICLGAEVFLAYGLHWAMLVHLGYMWIKSRKTTRLNQPGDNAPLSPSTPKSSKVSFMSVGSGRSGSSSALLSPTSSRHPSSTQLEQAATLREIQDILDHWAAWHRTMDRVEACFNWSDKSRSHTALALILFTYVPWLVLTWIIPMRFIVAFMGSIFICWRAPWFNILWAITMKLQAFSPLLQLIPYWPWKPEVHASYRKKRRFSVKDIIARAIGQRKKQDYDSFDSGLYNKSAYKSKTGYDIEEDHATMYYKFVLYENQRWWLGIDWTPMMLPNDRAPWTDDHIEPTQSKSAFQLPPPHVAHEAIPGQPNKVLRKSQEWRWLDPQWRLKLHGTSGECDAEGWEYANNHWQKWSINNRRGAYTRRRAWERTAKLIDQREIVMLDDIQDELAVAQAEDDSSSESENEIKEGEAEDSGDDNDSEEDESDEDVDKNKVK